MRSIASIKKFLEDKKAVFGLTSVQSFFAIILGVALLAYVIVVIMGTLTSTTILPSGSVSQTVVNETGWLNSTANAAGYTLTKSTDVGFVSPLILFAINGSSFAVIDASNYSVSAAGVVTKSTHNVLNFSDVDYTYSYSRDSLSRANADNILRNTSGGVTSFFSNINPVYAILAIMVIILVLIVLVRVVTGGTGEFKRASEPQL